MTDLQEKLASLSRTERSRLAAQLLEQRQRESTSEREPEIRPDPESRGEPFELTPLQEAYWMGRKGSHPLGELSSRAYLEVELEDVGVERVEAAWNRLVDRHDMLRAVVDADGRQRVLEEVPEYRIPLTELPDADDGDRRREIRRAILHGTESADEWPLFDLRASRRRGQQRWRLHLGLDLLIVDAASLTVLFRELGQLLEAPDRALPGLEITFRDYRRAVSRLRDGEQFRKSLAYWDDRLEDLPSAPDLPLSRRPEELDAPSFRRRTATLDAETTVGLERAASERGVTLSALLLAAYGEVLSRWSGDSALTINVPVLNRLPLHEDVDRVVGPFSSVELLEYRRGEGDDFKERAGAVQKRLLEDLEHRIVGGVEVMREMARRRGQEAARMPVVFTSLLDHAFDEQMERIGSVVGGVNQTAQVWLDLHVERVEGELIVRADAVDALFPDGLVRDLLGGYRDLLSRLATDEEAWVASDPVRLPEGQRRRRERANDTDERVPEVSLPEVITDRGRRHPSREAITGPGTTLTYRELLDRAHGVAHWLRDQNLDRTRPVAVAMRKGWKQVVGVLGVLHAGAPYLPVDVEQPRRRRDDLVRNAGAGIVLTTPELAGELDWPEGVSIRAVDETTGSDHPDRAPLDPPDPEDPAYVMYTSGSTGSPKGVTIRHESVVNRMEDVRRRFDLDGDTRAIGLTALHHDLSVFDVFGTLFAGGTLVLPDPDRLREPAHWADVVREHSVNTWNSVPAFMRMFVEFLEGKREPSSLDGKAGCDSAEPLRLVLLSGDWIPVGLPDRIRRQAPSARVVSLGGPTETTVWDICYPVGRVGEDWESIPYGRPMANARYYVLDDEMRPCPDWVTGELYIAGTGVAEEYWNDPERTAERFGPHPDTGERVYRSGDLGRWTPDGVLQFRGRADRQLQIQGHRVEPAEVEAAMEEHPQLREAVVIGRDRGEGRILLTGYAVPDGDSGPPDDRLREFLADRLPAHMVPAHFVWLDELPLNRNGKVDTSALPEPAEPTVEARAADPDGPEHGSRGPVREIAGIAADVLEVDRLEPDQDLLRYGANSIDMVRLGNRLEERFGSRPRMDELFRLRTVSDLAKRYGDSASGSGDGQAEPADKSAEAGGGGSGERERLARVLERVPEVTDPEARERFKRERRNFRTVEEQRTVDLPAARSREQRRARHRERRSCRRFADRALDREDFGHLLECLRPTRSSDGDLKYRYASAGGLYPNQVYLHLKEDRVAGLAGGSYYYDPREHRLELLQERASVPSDIHIPFVNQPVYEEAAFSLFIVAKLEAIAPAYRDRSLHFSKIEAGTMSHELELSAAEHGLGLCHIGTVDFDRIRDLFDLDPDHLLVHSFVGGVPAE